MNLQLSLKKQWFYLTKSGIKTEDYREITPYWCKRFVYDYFEGLSDKINNVIPNQLGLEETYFDVLQKTFNTNTMTLGYPKRGDQERILVLEHKGIEIRTGNPEWGAEPNKLYFVIRHGEIIK